MRAGRASRTGNFSCSPHGTQRGAWSARNLLILPPLLQKSPWWEGSPTLHLGPQHPMSTHALDSFTQVAQQHHTLRGPLTVVICPCLVSLPSLCGQRSHQAPVPEIPWSCLLQGPHIHFCQFFSVSIALILVHISKSWVSPQSNIY